MPQSVVGQGIRMTRSLGVKLDCLKCAVVLVMSLPKKFGVTGTEVTKALPYLMSKGSGEK
jgi:hypothetical protein